jgi:hypothetical protein
MSALIKVIPHPLGVVVINDDGDRELLIEGECCCGVCFDELQHIAAAGRVFKASDADAESWRQRLG